MSDITIYQKPTCSTCRQAVQLLKESGRPFIAINYYEKPFTKSQLKALLRKAKLSPRDVLRTIVEEGEKALLARPAETVKNIL
jgi:arsenate reductase